MSYATVISNLKLLNQVVVLALDPGQHVDHMHGESDRATIILMASSIEGFLVAKLQSKMPDLNNEESKRIFNFEGPCGSFSNRARLAHGLGIIDRPTRKKIEVIKEMRNAAAHSFVPLSFAAPPIAAGVAYLFPHQYAEAIQGWPNEVRKAAFVGVGGRLCKQISGDDPEWNTLYEMLNLPPL